MRLTLAFGSRCIELASGTVPMPMITTLKGSNQIDVLKSFLMKVIKSKSQECNQDHKSNRRCLAC